MNKDSLKGFLSEKIYLTPFQAKREIERRRNDPLLVKKVQEFLKDQIPLALRDTPKAVLARVLATPNYEFFEFQKLAIETGLEGWCLEYTQDKFRAENFDKYYLGKLYFNGGLGKKGGEKLTAKKIIDFDLAEGKRISDIKTLWGEDFVDFHHRLVKRAISTRPNFEDSSEWIEKCGKKSTVFYPYYLALFICHGVLFENFLIDDEPLIENMFLPAIGVIYKEFGLYPLIVPLSSFDKEQDRYWRHYPVQIEAIAQQGNPSQGVVK